jgi:hypothetical protein
MKVQPQSATQEPEQEVTEEPALVAVPSAAEPKLEQETKDEAELKANAKLKEEAKAKEEAELVAVPEAEAQAKADEEAKSKSAPAEPEAPTGPAVTLEFHQGIVAITKRPVQIVFDYTKSPVEVCKVAGHGAELGVKEGWTIKSMDGKEVDADFQVFYGRFMMRLNSLPGDFVLPLLFKREDGSLKTIMVPRAPLGMSLDKKLPAPVRNVAGLSAQLGIKAGWTLLRYADILLESHPDFATFFEDFKLVMGKLPQNN